MKTTIPTGDLLDQDRNAGILRFTGRRSVISTGALNGGIRHDLTAIYNHNDCPRAGKYCEMQGDTMEEHQAHIAASLGLDPQHTTGLHTGANIDNTAIVSLSYDDFSVTAMVTAGVEVNACRVGDPAVIHERDGGAFLLGGTINIVVAVDANLTDHCLARALVTCTEAKVAALQELVVSGRYSMGLATGSGTDGTIIVGNSDSAVRLTEAGEQYKLGEYLGKAVMQAVKQALYRQTGLCTGMQHSVFRRLERFGVTEPAVWEVYLRMCSQPVDHTVCGYDGQNERRRFHRHHRLPVRTSAGPDAVGPYSAPGSGGNGQSTAGADEHPPRHARRTRHRVLRGLGSRRKADGRRLCGDHRPVGAGQPVALLPSQNRAANRMQKNFLTASDTFSELMYGKTCIFR